jgi:hypothetical protein
MSDMSEDTITISSITTSPTVITLDDTTGIYDTNIDWNDDQLTLDLDSLEDKFPGPIAKKLAEALDIINMENNDDED